MSIDIGKFKQDGKEPGRDVVKENILRILRANVELAFSSKELESMIDARRQTIHQSLRSLESEGLITRRFVEENKRQVCYAKYNKEVNDDGKQETVRQGPEEVFNEEITEESEPEEKDSEPKEEDGEPKKKSKKRKKPKNT